MKSNISYHTTINRVLLLFMSFMLVFMQFSPVFSLTNEQRRVINSGIYYYDTDTGEPKSSCALPGNNNEEMVWNFFLNQDGYTPAIIAGMIGNMVAESGVLPKRLQNRPATEEVEPQAAESSSLGYGLVQWTPAKKMITTSIEEGVPYGDIGTIAHQADFLRKQLDGEYINKPDLNEKTAGDHLKQQTTVEDAARSFMLRFERPKDQSESKVNARIALAEDAFNRLSSVSGGSSGCTGSGDWGWPMEPAGRITSCFGNRVHPISGATRLHTGIDIGGDGIQQLLASDSGRVEAAINSDRGYGKHIIIDHGNGYKTLYGHASVLHVQTGDQVQKGQHIADEGSTGSSTAPHLHFEIFKDEARINPLDEMKIIDGVGNGKNCTGSAN